MQNAKLLNLPNRPIKFLIISFMLLIIRLNKSSDVHGKNSTKRSCTYPNARVRLFWHPFNSWPDGAIRIICQFITENFSQWLWSKEFSSDRITSLNFTQVDIILAKIFKDIGYNLFRGVISCPINLTGQPGSRQSPWHQPPCHRRCQADTSFSAFADF